jgi:hypothetical protein
MNSTASLATQQRLRFLNNGYLPIPVTSPDPKDPQCGKKPALTGWSEIIDLEPEEVHLWDQRYPHAKNTGILCGATVGLDIDIDDEAIVSKIEAVALRILGAEAPIRVGRAPRALIVCRTETPFKKKCSREFILPNGQTAKVEILGQGQQFVADGIHPITGQPYWWKGVSIADTPLSELPKIDEQKLETFLEQVDHVMRDSGLQERKPVLQIDGTGKRTAKHSSLTVDPELVQDALAFVPNVDADYDFWLRIGFALHSALGSDGFTLWDEWSRKSPKHDPNFTRKTWKSFKQDGGINVGTLFFAARQNGWRKNQKTDTRPTIVVKTGELHETVDQAENALLSSDIELFQRGGILVRLVYERDPVDPKEHCETVKLLPVCEQWLHETLMRVATFQRQKDETGELVTINCPSTIAKTYLARVGQWKLPILTAIVQSPTIRADGSILDRPGFDPVTGLYAAFNPSAFPKVIKCPNKEDAIEAMKLLKSSIATFPFNSAADLSVALAAILTGLTRHVLVTAPMFGYSAPVAGSGKSLLVDLTSIIVKGHPAAVLAPGKTEEELEKRLGAAFIHGASVVSLDNCTEALNGAFLCQVLTQPRVQIRILGQSKNIEVPTNCLIVATGNNLTFAEDMTRRVLLCTLNPKVERPEERQFGADIYKETLRQRSYLVIAALTILRAFVLAGRPQSADVLGSFPDWSRLIRSTLVWLNEVDPCDTMERVRNNDPSLAKNIALLHEIDLQFGKRKFTVAELINVAQERISNGGGGYKYMHDELHQTLSDFSGGKDSLNSIAIGKALGRLVDRICEGMTIVKTNGPGGKRLWQLVGGSHIGREDAF